jgi:hypothetical protein
MSFSAKHENVIRIKEFVLVNRHVIRIWLVECECHLGHGNSSCSKGSVAGSCVHCNELSGVGFLC